jgi:acetylornithine deacetylase
MIVASHKFFGSRSDTPRLGMLFVVGEEIGGTGMKAFASYAKNTTFRAAIFGEPTEGKLASGHKGSLGLTLDVKGKSAHSAYPWLGVSAVNYLAEAIVALNMLEPALPKSELLGATTLNTGLIRGGVAGNVVAEAANASVSIRIARSEDDAVAVVREMVTGMLSPLVARAKKPMRLSASFSRTRRIRRPSWTRMLRVWKSRLCSTVLISQVCRKWRRGICSALVLLRSLIHQTRA